MIRFPGGVWLEPADLGFNAAVIAAAGNLDGRIVPWRVLHRFRLITFNLRQTGLASTVSVRLNQELDFDGVTVLRSGISGFWTSADNGSVIAFDLANNAGTPLTHGAGTPLAAPFASFWMAPYLQLNILNNDGVNAATVTLRAGLFQ